jgi:hypothetical protein
MNDYSQTSHSPTESDSVTVRPGRAGALRSLSRRKSAWFVAAGLTCAMVGLGASTASADGITPPGGGGGARSAPSQGGSTGIVDSTSASGFTFKTATGVEVTVDETASTKYKFGPLPAPSFIVHKGESVLTLGVVDSATITASEVDVQVFGDGGAAAAKASGVIGFQSGTASQDKSVGQVPTDYTEGDGTIQSGAVADKATKAAQAVFPGGIADRVVLLADGEYEVHNISINWPHHVFVSSDFKVLGAF